MKLARVLGAVGRILITAGVLILLFVAYQLWGTGIRERQAQDRLEKRFQDKLDQAGVDLPTVGTLPPNPASPLAAALNEGDPVGRLEIPRISGDDWIVEGVGVEDLKKGPGHYPETPLPGQTGNAGIAGHRTTYGAPFAEIDNLAPGDKIMVTTVQGHFTYEVIDPCPADHPVEGCDPGSGHVIVGPNDYQVLNDIADNDWLRDRGFTATLTLTACHPKYSAAQRIIVYASLVGEPAPTPPAQKPKPTLAAGASIGGDRGSLWPVILFGLLCALIWLGAWFASKKWRKWPPYAIGLLPFLVSLFFFFENFSRLLPSNF